MTSALGYRLGFVAPPEVDVALPVCGHIPEWLCGSLYRLSAVRHSTEAGWRAHHWLDGLAMLYRFSITNGKATFCNRFLQSRQFLAAQHGWTWGHEIAASASWRIPGAILKAFAPTSDNTNLNVCRLNDRYLALNESKHQYEFDPCTLDTLGLHSYDDSLPRSMAMGAHPLVDPVTCELINVGTRYRPPCRIFVYTVAPGTNCRSVVASYPVSRPPWIHSFCITRRKIILVHHPYFFNPWRFAFSGSAVINNFVWQPEAGTTFVVIDRAAGTCHYYDAEPTLMIHSVNAYDDGKDVVVDLLCYPDPRVLADGLGLSESGHPRAIETPEIPCYRISELKRFRLRPGQGKADMQKPFDVELEFPAVNERVARGNSYRYLYGIGPDRKHSGPGYLSRLYKFDLERGEVHSTGTPETYLNEPIFVGAPDATAEDKGVLLVPVLYETQGSSALLVLDARSLEQVAVLRTPVHLPFGLHGQFFPGSLGA